MSSRFTLNRRSLLAGGAALSAASILPIPAARSQISSMPVLRASPTTAALRGDAANPTPVWGYEGTSPGPEIRVKAGERVRRRLVNGLPQNTALHWHGIRIDNAMDGVPGLTQETVQPGETFDYDFVAPDAGTYFYHSHDRSWEQNARGLHGPLIVEDPEPWKGADRELVLHVDDWFLDADGAIDEESMGEISDWAHGGRIGNLFTANGKANARFEVRSNERIRLRVINAANARIMAMTIKDHSMVLVALDGHPVEPRSLEDNILILSPSQRADIVVDFSAEPGSMAALTSWFGEDDWRPVATFAYGREKALPRKTEPVAALPAWMKHDLDLENAKSATLVMQGGAMGTMQTASFEGRERSFQELAALKKVWAFNGSAGGMKEPLFTTTRGRTVKLTIRNESRWPHAMHLHGHHFKVLTRDGVKDPYQDWHDTVLNQPRESLEIAFDAGNPGKWLLHCHMLEHQAGGMVTWFNVA